MIHGKPNNHLKRTPIEGVEKDASTGALINTNTGKLESYKKQKQLYRDIQLLKETTKTLSEELELVKNMLKTVLNQSKVE
jgi:hypothetical protein